MTDLPHGFFRDGTEITPGIYEGIPMTDYLELPGVSRSQLWSIREQSPAHMRWKADKPRSPDDTTKTLLRGAALHDCVLLPDVFDSFWYREPPGDGRTKAVKEARAAAAAEHLGATPLPASDFDACLAVRDAVQRHSRARQLLVGDAEQTALWDDPETGVFCRGRWDLIGHKSRSVVDLKSTRSAAHRDFEKSIFRYGYHVQGAHYIDGAHALGVDADRFAMIAVEMFPPFELAIYVLDDESLAYGRMERSALMDVFAYCRDAGDWFGYPREPQLISLPKWAVRQLEQGVV